jgi:hypothetical protein
MGEQIAVSLNLSDGRTLRFGGDEADVENIPYDISFDTQIPGGFNGASITLPKPANLYSDDARLFSDAVIYGAGGRTLYEGFVTSVPQVGANEIRLELSGWAQALDRYQTFKEIFVDRDLNAWTEPWLDRRISLRDTSNWQQVNGPETLSDESSPGLMLKLDGGRSNVYSEAWYDAGAGSSVRNIYYELTSADTTSSYVAQLGTASDDVATASDSTADLLTGTDSSATGTYTRTGSAYRYGRVLFYLIGTVSNLDAEIRLRNLAVFGDHGLTLRGTYPKGVFGSDVIRYVIAQTLLNSTSESVESSSEIIRHLAFREDTPIPSVIEQVTAIGSSTIQPIDWGVYEDKTFFWRTPGTYGRTWHVRRDQVATPTSDGPQADQRVAGIKVIYSDASGRERSVGPVGSNADTETNDLLSIDPDNPASQIPGAFEVVNVGLVPLEQSAINIGKLILNERNALRWRGSVELQGEATDENGNRYPVALVRAGDTIVIEDDADTTPRTINSTSYTHSDLRLTANVGARPDTLESLLGRLAAVTELFGA